MRINHSESAVMRDFNCRKYKICLATAAKENFEFGCDNCDKETTARRKPKSMIKEPVTAVVVRSIVRKETVNSLINTLCMLERSIKKLNVVNEILSDSGENLNVRY